MADRIPRDKTDDYSEEMARQRREFVSAKTSTPLDHIAPLFG